MQQLVAVAEEHVKRQAHDACTRRVDASDQGVGRNRSSNSIIMLIGVAMRQLATVGAAEALERPRVDTAVGALGNSLVTGRPSADSPEGVLSDGAGGCGSDVSLMCEGWCGG